MYAGVYNVNVPPLHICQQNIMMRYAESCASRYREKTQLKKVDENFPMRYMAPKHEKKLR